MLEYEEQPALLTDPYVMMKSLQEVQSDVALVTKEDDQFLILDESRMLNKSEFIQIKTSR